MIPVLSLQPIVENAIKHGIAPLASGGTVTVTARLEDQELRITVHDTGRGFESTNRSGVGLENVERRLELSYGSAAHLEIESTPQGSTVTIAIPSLVEATR